MTTSGARPNKSYPTCEKFYRFVVDHLDSVMAVVDANTGVVAQRLEYDARGRVLVDTNPGFQPFGYAGGIWDRDVGLVRFGARDYDPELGQWTAKDPIEFGGPWGTDCQEWTDDLIDSCEEACGR